MNLTIDDVDMLIERLRHLSGASAQLRALGTEPVIRMLPGEPVVITAGVVLPADAEFGPAPPFVIEPEAAPDMTANCICHHARQGYGEGKHIYPDQIVRRDFPSGVRRAPPDDVAEPVPAKSGPPDEIELDPKEVRFRKYKAEWPRLRASILAA